MSKELAISEAAMTRRAQSIRARWERAGHRSPERESQRAFQSSQWATSNLGFAGEWRTADGALRFDLPFMRARSRELAQENPYLQGAINAILNNVLGPNGVHWQSKVVNSVARFGDPVALDKQPDKKANDIIDTAFMIATDRDNYLVTRDLSKMAADRLKLRLLFVDGEYFVRTFKPFDNRAGIARQIIEADMCDHEYNVADIGNGGTIRLGIEYDRWGAETAVHFLTRPKQDYQYQGSPPSEYRVRVPSTEIRHVFIKHRPGQSRGIPMTAAALLQLRKLSDFEAAAVMNAIIGARRNLFYTKQFPTGWTPEVGMTGLPKDTGAIIDDLGEADTLELPYGVEPKMVDTRYPDGEMGIFVQCILRSIASALGMSYSTISNDLSQNNFASSRVGLNEERNQWAAMQQFFIETDCVPDFRDWLRWALSTQSVKLPESRFDKFNAMQFTGRTWPAVNPLQDRAAEVMAINNLLMSRSEVIRNGGREPDEVLAEIAADRDKANAVDLHPEHDPNLQAQAVQASIAAQDTPPTPPK